MNNCQSRDNRASSSSRSSLLRNSSLLRLRPHYRTEGSSHLFPSVRSPFHDRPRIDSHTLRITSPVVSGPSSESGFGPCCLREILQAALDIKNDGVESRQGQFALLLAASALALASRHSVKANAPGRRRRSAQRWRRPGPHGGVASGGRLARRGGGPQSRRPVCPWFGGIRSVVPRLANRADGSPSTQSPMSSRKRQQRRLRRRGRA